MVSGMTCLVGSNVSLLNQLKKSDTETCVKI